MRFLKNILALLLLASLEITAQHSPFSAAQTLQHIKYLSSENLSGRYPGTEGDIRAANYIRDRLSVSGLEMMFSNGFQVFEVITGVSLAEGNVFETESFDAEIEKDFVPLSFSANGSASGPVVFAGYGIVMPGRWDDYASIEATGKWVLVLTGDPEPGNPQSDFIAVASDRMKAITARDKGAIGLLLVKGAATGEDDELMPAYYDKNASDARLPVINITRKLADHLITGRGFTITNLEKELQTSMQPFSFETFAAVNATVSLVQNRVSTQNIVAKLPGTDSLLKDEYIVIGAHYDHLGMGGTSSGSRMPDNITVHPGADDNASGVAALIELASDFATRNVGYGRSILFVAFGAEEMGLIGAKHFVDNPPVPPRQMKAMINLDMIGRLKDDPVLTIGGTGTAKEFEGMIAQLEGKRIFTINRQPDGYGPSDHAAFYASSIPVLFVTTGPHEDFHTPYDTWEKLNMNGLIAIQEFVLELAVHLANQVSAPTFTESGAIGRRGHGRGYKIALGIIPDIASTKNGLGVDGVRQGGPAAQAGIRKGDLIVSINGLPVGNIYEYMARLNTLSAGETVIVEVMRNGKKEILLVQL